jgi:hypothetical protein
LFSAIERDMKHRAIFFFIFIFLLCGCSRFNRKFAEPLQPEPFIEDPQLTSHVLASLKHTNMNLKSFKGIGRITSGGGPQALQRARAVFAGYQAEKLRFEVLGLSGQPITSIAYDGTWFYLAQHSENRFYRKRFPNADLNQLLNIPIKINTINLLLSGQVPMIDHVSAQLEREPSGNAYVLLLKRGWWRWRQQEKIYLTADMKTVWKYEMFEASDKPVYCVEIKDIENYQGYQVPKTIEILGENGTKFMLEVVRYWANADVEMSLFVLKPPNK